MTLLNWLGFIVCLLGISLHVGLKTYYSKGSIILDFHLISQQEIPVTRETQQTSSETTMVTFASRNEVCSSSTPHHFLVVTSRCYLLVYL